MKFSFHTFFFLLLPVSTMRAGEVTLSQDERIFRISNGGFSATIEKSSARVTSATLGGQELLGSGSGYWSMSASSAESRVSSYGRAGKQTVSINPASNGGERAEVVCHFHGIGSDGAFPGNTEIRYAIDRHSNTLYATAIMSHGKGDAPFRIGEGRFVIKLDAGIFDQLTVDRDRNQIMPTGEDWEAGAPLNLIEARRMTTGVRKGWAEHKYSYSAMLGEVPAYGWVGTRQPFGVWMINPSVEYIAGGPTKMELTGHLDVGGEALPTLLNMWHGSHYGGTSLKLARDETWSKVIGPFAIHFNQGGTPEDRLRAAYRQASAEQAAWPYPWLIHDEYPSAALRGGISGTLLVDEKRAVSPEDGALWVGLTVPEYDIMEGRASSRIGWQRDGKHYQYWVKAKPDGTFCLRGVRPGTYVMRAFADGVLGEFELPDLTIEAGASRSIGEIHWKPERAGPTLWEIGIPNRSAAEFHNGDRYWHWGNYLKFKSDFPKGVNYTVGKSDWRRDWHLCQPLNLSIDGKVLGDSTWRVRFPLDQIPAGGTRLRVAFCGSRADSRLALLLNGTEMASMTMPENGVMHRDSHRGMWFERAFDIPPDRLRQGENLLEFRLSGTAWHQGNLYDYIRMETH
jgi:rhamnogalacturonan endolyase